MMDQMTNIFLDGGYALMGIAAVGIVTATVIFFLFGKHLKKKLKDDYGEPWKYNL